MPTPSVDESELLIRQISPGGNPIYFDPARKPPVHQQAFLPSRKDADGLSLIRGRFRSDIWSAYRPEQPAVRFRLVHVQASGLDQVADDCGIREFSYQSTPDALDNQHGAPWGLGDIASPPKSTEPSTTPMTPPREGSKNGLSELPICLRNRMWLARLRHPRKATNTDQ
jgi:hypothetical protein